MHVLVISPGRGFDETPWRAVLGSGADALMIREPGLEGRALLDLARWCRATAPGMDLWINGRADIALAAGCGLHAGESYPGIRAGGLRWSRPLHDPTQFMDRREADQLLLSPVFAVPGKGAPLGAGGLHRWLEALPPFAGRLLALGGIGAANAGDLRHPRLDGLAVIRSVWEAEHPGRAVDALRRTWST